jgi:hypothetical protein
MPTYHLSACARIDFLINAPNEQEAIKQGNKLTDKTLVNLILKEEAQIYIIDLDPDDVTIYTP